MASEFLTFSSHRTGPADLRFLHYNDVYHIEAGSAEPVGGIARFQTLVNQYRSDPKYVGQSELLTLFSGDAYNPSLESSVTKGSHMVPILNKIGTAVACVGNHDLDFGVTQFRHLRDQCTFPWLLANVLDPGLGENVSLGDCPKTVILTSSNGIKVGIIGLVEREWLDTINSLPPHLIYKSASATANELVPALRDSGAEIVIALTHMREPNDLKLAEKTPLGLIDVILGGHDHFYAHHFVNGTHVLRSGSDFKQLSYIEARRKQRDTPGWDIDITRRDVVRDTAEDPATVKLVEKLSSSLRSKLGKPIGYTAVPLDGRFTMVRTRETNLGNFVCDLMRHYYNADCTIMASGTIRGDQIYLPGILRLKDILTCFPFEDPIVVIKVKGKAILAALENAVSLVPALEGRYPQVSNVFFEYDPKLPSGRRILWTDIGDDPLDMDKEYVLATRGYMGRGKDGYDSLLVKSEGGEAEEVVSEENGILISMILRQYFMSLKVLGRWRRWGPNLHRHWRAVHEEMSKGIRDPGLPEHARTTPMRNKHGNHHHHHHGHRTQVDGQLVDSDTDDEGDHAHHVPSDAEEKERRGHLMRTVSRKWMRLAGIQHKHVATADDDEEEFLPHWTRGIAPKLEGRILIREEKHEHSSEVLRQPTTNTEF